MSDHTRDWERDLQELRRREGLETAVNLRPTNVEQIRLSPQVEEYLAEQGGGMFVYLVFSSEAQTYTYCSTGWFERRA